SGQVLLSLLLIALLALAWSDYQLNVTSGGYVKVISPENLYSSYHKLAIRNAQILAPACSHFIDGKQVLLEEGKIVSIQPDSIAVNDYEIVDAQGQYLIPGLIDSHVHLKESKNDLCLYLANGVTYVREMTGTQSHLDWKQEINQGALGPNLYVASRKINSEAGFDGVYDSWTRNRINIGTPKAVKKELQQLREAGYDALKMSTFLNREVYDAITEQAKEIQLPVIGHIPFSVGLDTALFSGQTEFAHVEEITKSVMWAYGGYGKDNAQAFLAHLDSLSDEIAIQIRDRGIAVTTTIWLMESLPQQKFNTKAFTKQIPMPYANPALIEGSRFRKGWLPVNNSYAEPNEVLQNPERRAASKVFWETYVEAIHIMTRALAKHDVVLLAGTDANTTLTVPGFSLHDELASMVQLGLSPQEVLYSATVAPSIWMQSNTGKIEAGYQADLVLLSENPLLDIEHTRSVETVFRGSHWLSKAQITELLDLVKVNNDQEREVELGPYLAD
ncbi:MAG: amidohydrolase family protein, partial [Bacteroidota bacterium]